MAPPLQQHCDEFQQELGVELEAFDATEGAGRYDPSISVMFWPSHWQNLGVEDGPDGATAIQELLRLGITAYDQRYCFLSVAPPTLKFGWISRAINMVMDVLVGFVWKTTLRSWPMTTPMKRLCIRTCATRMMLGSTITTVAFLRSWA